MSAPIPKSPLTGHCSVVDNDVLYVLSPSSFQSLPLKANATWSTLSMGVNVTGPACVRAVPNGNEAQAVMYVVGGTSSDSNYTGLQRYSFASSSWETLDPPTSNMQDRTDHSVAYLNDTSSILVYAGSQPDAPSSLSSQTFLISTSSPYNIEAFTSVAPPLNQPILLPWNSSDAVLVGGATTNLEVYTFGPSNGWQALGTNLTSALPSTARGALISGSDGSKVLQVYDASVSPNNLTQLVLLDANGATAANGQTVGSSTSKKRTTSLKRKRDLTLQDWPTYNSSNAATAIRSDYNVAQSSDGTAVLTGGNNSSPINMFDESTNSWYNNTKFFEDSATQAALTTSSASSTKPTATATSKTSSTSATASATSSATTASDGVGKAHTLRVLGIVLGVLCGVAAVFILALLFMRFRKQRKKRASENFNEKSDRLSFADRGPSFVKEAEGPMADAGIMSAMPRHNFLENSHSHSSLAIITGKFGNASSNHQRGTTEEKGSFESTAKLVRSPGSQHSLEQPLELADLNARDADLISPLGPVTYDGANDPTSMENKKRSSGWSRYFAGEAANAAPAVQNNNHLSVPSPSIYSTKGVPSIASRIPPTVPPLDPSFGNQLDEQRMSAVAHGRPSFMHSAEDLAARGASLDMVEGQRADFHTGQSLESDQYLSAPDRESFNSSAYRESGSSADSNYFTNDHMAAAPWLASGVAQPAYKAPSAAIREIQVPHSPNASPAMSTSAFPRPPSSNYTADRDSRMPQHLDLPGRALSPPINGPVAMPSSLAVPFSLAGPGLPARSSRGNPNSGFFPGSGVREGPSLRPNSARKIGGLHPGTLAALGSSGLIDAQDEGVGWSSGDRKVSDSYAAAREELRLKREREEAQGKGLMLSGMSGRKTDEVVGSSGLGWLNLGSR